MNMKNLRSRETRHTSLHLIPPRQLLNPLLLFLMLRVWLRFRFQFDDQLLPFRRIRPLALVLHNQA
ncbi:hypothetical protein WI75_28170 [Burkholderia ubonensis]|nr:hypothetical protein WI75_28170 [Burkholderia ubonensis]KVG77070.1 hypothetical protein WJ34_01485 [Burkholderia ubonensis]KVL68500.1 hypothetical protein WJ49_28150 [Burkholderia ubonensis]KVM29774.1 hypothetical protein WJ54_12505 [Burkholderia ubonensis]KVQ89615.1 hypothetical protein WK10_32005 [Burkholderia ubonensis]